MMSDARRLLSRLGALAILIGLIAFFTLGVVRPLWSRLTQFETQITENRRQALAFRDRIENREVRQTSLPEGLIYAEGTPAVVLADIQGRFTASVEAAGGTPVSVLALEPVTEDGTIVLAVRMVARMDISQLATVLLDIERGRPLLVVESLAISRDRRPEVPKAPELSVQIVAKTLIDAE